MGWGGVCTAPPTLTRTRTHATTTPPSLQIAESDQLEEGVRTLAAEFLVTLCEAREKAPGMMRKLPQVCMPAAVEELCGRGGMEVGGGAGHDAHAAPGWLGGVVAAMGPLKTIYEGVMIMIMGLG